MGERGRGERVGREGGDRGRGERMERMGERVRERQGESGYGEWERE